MKILTIILLENCSTIDKHWNVGGPLMWGALGPGLLGLGLRMALARLGLESTGFLFFILLTISLV